MCFRGGVHPRVKHKMWRRRPKVCFRQTKVVFRVRFGPVSHTGSVSDPSGVRLGVFSHTGLLNPEEIGFSGSVPKNNFRRMVG